ncbi:MULTISPECIES: hypothetical protein [unclassified Streptomyces]|uniref:hypothetical protein n=1 Tax=unclassified Streptomyces TaxID=2593676 RepID=UPI00344CCDC8
MQPTDDATTNPSLVVADMDSLILECDADLAKDDAELVRLSMGVAALQSKMAELRCTMQKKAETRDGAKRVREDLLRATRAGVALRSGQRQGGSRGADASEPGGSEAVDDADAPAGSPPPATDTPATEGGDHTEAAESPTTPDASTLGPRTAQALQVITSEPGLRWTPKLLATQLEGQEAAADQKAHNRARALMDGLAKKHFLVKHQDAERRCHFTLASTAGAA